MILISIIIPVKNCSKFLDECFQSIINQDIFSKANEKIMLSCDAENNDCKRYVVHSPNQVEISLFDDHSEDQSIEIIRSWIETFNTRGFRVIFSENLEDHSDKTKTGCGYAKNRAVSQSQGLFLCFQDADDVMLEDRLRLQFEAALGNPECLIGSNFLRDPPSATPRYSKWCNSLSKRQLITQQYRECTIVQPTWFCSRELFERVGGYEEKGPYSPEDLIFFHKHLDLGGSLYKVDKELVIYRRHENTTSQGIHRLDLMSVRLAALECRVLSRWTYFTIWGAGRDGRKFFAKLSTANKRKVIAFCDVDIKKIGTIYHQAYTNLKVPIIHYREAKPPIIICVALDRSNGVLEKNIASLHIEEGVDYYHFN